MNVEGSELKLVFDVLLDEMFAAMNALRRRQNLLTDVHEEDFVIALRRYESARLRWLIALDDLRAAQSPGAERLKTLHHSSVLVRKP